MANYDIVRDKMRQDNRIYSVFRNLAEQDYSFRELRGHLPITDTELMDSLSYLKRNKIIDGENTYCLTEKGQVLIDLIDREAEEMAKKSKKHLNAIQGRCS